MFRHKGFQAYKKYWEDQASFMDQSPWNLTKVLKLAISNDFDQNIQELEFSNHSISREGGQITLRLKVPYNYSELDDFKVKAIDLLGIDNNWLVDIGFENSNCSHDLKNKNVY